MTTARAMVVHDAVLKSPFLSRLGEKLSLSREYLMIVRPMLPINWWPLLEPGPVEDGSWCLLVRSSAVAYKLKQMQPDIESSIADVTGMPIKLRIKLLS
jgi:hypothetical protein